MVQKPLQLNIPRNSNLKLLPVKKLAKCKCEREALRVCLDNAPMDLSNDQWAALLKISKSTFSNYLKPSKDRPRHLPERIRHEAQLLAGNLAITQYWCLKYRHSLVPMGQQEKENYLEQRLKELGDD